MKLDSLPAVAAGLGIAASCPCASFAIVPRHEEEPRLSQHSCGRRAVPHVPAAGTSCSCAGSRSQPLLTTLCTTRRAEPPLSQGSTRSIPLTDPDGSVSHMIRRPTEATFEITHLSHLNTGLLKSPSFWWLAGQPRLALQPGYSWRRARTPTVRVHRPRDVASPRPRGVVRRFRKSVPSVARSPTVLVAAPCTLDVGHTAPSGWWAVHTVDLQT